MFQQLLAFSILLVLMVSLFYSKYLIRISIVCYGFLVAEFYFVFFPLLYFAITGVLEMQFTPFSFRMIIENETFSLLLLLFYTLSLLLVFFVLVIINSKKISNRHIAPPVNNERKTYVFIVLLYFILSLFVIIQSNVLNGGHWFRSRGDFLESSGNVGVVSLYLIWGIRFLIVAMTFDLLSRKIINFIWAGTIVVVISVFELLYVGNRIVVVMFGVAGLLYIFKNFGFKGFVVSVLSIFPVALGLGAYQDVRYLLFTETKFETFGKLVSIFLQGNSIFDIGSGSFILKIFEYADFIVLFRLFNDVGVLIKPQMGLTLAKAFVWFIPRSIWAGKPENISVLVGNYYMPGANVSLAVLFFGEMHYNFGVVGIILLPLVMTAFVYLLHSVLSSIPARYYLSFLAGFVLFRQSLATVLISIFMAVVIYKTSVIFISIVDRLSNRRMI